MVEGGGVDLSGLVVVFVLERESSLSYFRYHLVISFPNRVSSPMADHISRVMSLVSYGM